MKAYHEVFRASETYLEALRTSQRDSIIRAATLISDCMRNEGIVHLYGENTGHAFSMELGSRAGGFVQFHRFNPEDLILKGLITQEEYLQDQLLKRQDLPALFYQAYRIEPQDMYILITLDGTKGAIIDLAKRVKEEKRKLIVLISKKYEENHPSLHPTGKKLSDFADVVLDYGIHDPDMITRLNGIAIGQLSTIGGNTIAQLLTAEIYHQLEESHDKRLILLSDNIKGSDAINKENIGNYLGRYNS